MRDIFGVSEKSECRLCGGESSTTIFYSTPMYTGTIDVCAGCERLVDAMHEYRCTVHATGVESQQNTGANA